MGNRQFDVPAHVREEWQEVQVGHHRLLRNKNSLQIFNFLVLTKLREEANISHLIERSIYSLPRTPKVIILSDQNGQMSILVEEFHAPLSDFRPQLLLPTDLLTLLLSLSQLLGSLFTKYGPFGLRDTMLGLNKNLEVMGWINSQKHRNEPELPLQKSKTSEREMLVSLLAIVSKQLCLPDSLMFPSFATSSFTEFQTFLTRYIFNKKKELACQTVSPQKGTNRTLRPMSPQTSFGSLKMAFSSKAERPSFLPRFLQKDKKKQLNVPKLDGLCHRRTNTIKACEMKTENGRSGSNASKVRENSPEKSLSRVRSWRGSPARKKEVCLGYGQDSGLICPCGHNEKCDGLASTASSKKLPILKREFSDYRSLKGEPSKIQQSFPRTPKPFYTHHTDPVRDLNGMSFDLSSESCIFNCSPKPPDSPEPTSLGKIESFPQAHHSEAKSSKYIGKEVIVEQESRQDISKNLEDELNDFFSNPASPRFLSGTLGEQAQLQLEEEFNQLIGF